MNRAELVDVIASKTGLSKKDTSKALEALVSTVKETLASGDKITLIGFGTFEVRERSAREGRNPQTGETIKIAASKVPAFKPGKAFKEELNESFIN